jgi:hypothetical protein
LSDPGSHCRICAEPLPEGARKCTKCGEFQTFLARLLAGLDLHGLVALVPVATLAFVFLQERVGVVRSDLRFALVACSQTDVSLMASNVGNRAGVIAEASYNLGNEQPRQLILELKPDARLVDGGKTRIFELRVDHEISPGGLVPFEMQGRPDCQVVITVETFTFEQHTKKQKVICDCSSPSFS